MATKKKTTKKKKKATRRKKVAAKTKGLAATELTDEPPEVVQELSETIESDGGAVLAAYRDPLGGKWQLLVSLPLDIVRPSVFQRDLSDTHVKKLVSVIDRLERYLDPIILVRTDDGEYSTPNGHHRYAAMKKLGAQAITGVLIPEVEVAYQILALNTEKAPNLKDRSLEVIRLARALTEIGDPPEVEFEVQFEDPAYLTIGCCYEKKARFSGSTYHPILKKCEGWFEDPISECIEVREERADRLLEIDDRVAQLVKALKDRGFDSPYLKPYVVARLNPLRGPKAAGDFDETMDKILEKADKFDVAKVDASQISASGGYSPSE
ncbi:MAG: ParB N-terminal domain-containing protein [Myxococcota bacterium]